MSKSRWSKLFGIVSLAALSVGIFGCNKPSTTSASDEESDVAAAESELAQAEPMRQGTMGPGMLLGAALHDLELTDAQKATIKAEMDALRSGADKRGEHEAMHKALAAAVRSGKVDEAALLAQLPQEPGDLSRVAKAIGVLHDTLTAAQRKQLVEAVETKMEKHGEHGMREHKGDREGREHARENKGERDGAREGGREHGPGMMGPMGHLLHDLDLTDAQREQIHEAMKKSAPSEADREAMKAAHDSFRKAMHDRLETFAADSFDAKAFVAPPADAKMGPKGMAGGMIKMVATVTPILTDAQRETLAKHLEEGPPAGKHHARGE